MTNKKPNVAKAQAKLRKGSRLLGDAQAAQSGAGRKRVARRAANNTANKGIGKLFK